MHPDHAIIELRTDRLVLRPWRDSDRAPFAALNADPAVMEHFPSVLSRHDSDALVDRIEAGFEQRGWGLWAVEVVDPTIGAADFAGFTGLNPVPDTLPAAPGVEVGWRLAHPFWGVGIATEAARAVLALAFESLGLAQVVSFTAATNGRSQRVMQKVGMRHDPSGDFDHPAMPEGHRLRRHVLYRIDRPSLRPSVPPST